ncbi:MAG: aspartyl/glutamyl-tRNA amidotransferase subunit A [Candidatus Melainabacteria bacterium LEY3_CP_29_8]|nr:MAG: aspartyl/glutamyl-tRNA amidotransferase subunit A [Candidatus Melainabacteria bacterium LEY3_CP_29_8]
MDDILKKTALETGEMIQKKEIKAIEVLNAVYKRIDEVECKIGAFNSLTRDYAYSVAKEVDRKVENNESLPPLAGVPLALKDNINLIGSKTTASSKILENFVSPYDATVTKKLKQNYIPVVGKTNLDEFAMGSSNENSAFNKVHNPWNLDYVPGGSSGGSAASVASLTSYIALGSDTGGSIRLPASFCGVCGMKPTYGKVSRYGLIAFASSLDQIGPFGRSVKDLAASLNVIQGCDPCDSTSLNVENEDYLNNIENDIKGRKIGVVKELVGDGLSSDVQKAIQNSIEVYKKLGAQIVEISLPLLKHSIGVYYILATAEASSNLARFDGVKYGYRAKNCENLLEMYTKTRAEGFGDEVRRLIADDFNRAFEKVDVLLSTTSPTTAFKLGEKANDPLSMYLTDIATIGANLAGIPALSIPCGFDASGLPIGLQLSSKALSESLLLNTAYNFERETEFSNQFAQL